MNEEKLKQVIIDMEDVLFFYAEGELLDSQDYSGTDDVEEVAGHPWFVKSGKLARQCLEKHKDILKEIE